MRLGSGSSVRRLRAALTTAGAILLLGLVTTAPALACSPPFEEPSVTALADGAVVVVGWTGDKVDGGRLFRVERVFSGDLPTTPIVIAFQEGEPVGDCSYPMGVGVHLVIAPDQDADGTLRANLATLQADPDSELGRRYLAEARARYGDGAVPSPSGADLRLVALAVVLVAGIAAIWFAWRRTRRTGQEGR